MIRPPIALTASGRVVATSSSVAKTSAAASLVVATSTSEALHPPHRWRRSPRPSSHLRRWYRRTPSSCCASRGGDCDSVGGGGVSPGMGEEEPSSEILLAHYEGRRRAIGEDDDLLTRILSAVELELEDVGRGTRDVSTLAEMLHRVDEFHVGGREATDRLLSSVTSVAAPETDSCDNPTTTAAIRDALDLGCSLGGPARRLASFFGPECSVVGVDLSPEFVGCAQRLTELTSPDDVGRGNLSFVVGSVLDLPFDDKVFDLATMMHVGMNVRDKDPLFREVVRVLRPQGGLFAVYDLVDTTMSRGNETGDGEGAMDGDGQPPSTAELCRLRYPVPWASDPSHSFVSTAETYRHAAYLSGLDLVHDVDRGDEAREFFRKQQRRRRRREKQSQTVLSGGESAPPPTRLDMSLVLGEDAEEKLGNVALAVESGVVSPVEFVFRSTGGR